MLRRAYGAEILRAKATLQRRALSAEAVRAHRSVEFLRRSALYGRLDLELRHRTRFFAAAATINTVFARLMDALPVLAPPSSCTFLSEAGAALEIANLNFASEISMRTPRDIEDRTLVLAEQRLLQCLVQAQQARSPRQWAQIRRQLNILLNHRYVASLSGWGSGTASFSRALGQVRRSLGRELDFGTESHRVRIGLALIDEIRNRVPLYETA